MSKNIKIKSIAFNLDDPDQAKMFEHAGKRTNFSSYIKRLIQRDIESEKQGEGINRQEDKSIDDEEKKFMQDFV